MLDVVIHFISHCCVFLRRWWCCLALVTIYKHSTLLAATAAAIENVVKYKWKHFTRSTFSIQTSNEKKRLNLLNNDSCKKPRSELALYSLYIESYGEALRENENNHNTAQHFDDDEIISFSFRTCLSRLADYTHSLFFLHKFTHFLYTLWDIKYFSATLLSLISSV